LCGALALCLGLVQGWAAQQHNCLQRTRRARMLAWAGQPLPLHPALHLHARWPRACCAHPRRGARPRRARPRRAQVSLVAGAGARRLAEVRCRAAVQLLLVQAAGEIYVAHAPRLPQARARQPAGGRGAGEHHTHAYVCSAREMLHRCESNQSFAFVRRQLVIGAQSAQPHADDRTAQSLMNCRAAVASVPPDPPLEPVGARRRRRRCSCWTRWRSWERTRAQSMLTARGAARWRSRSSWTRRSPSDTLASLHETTSEQHIKLQTGPHAQCAMCTRLARVEIADMVRPALAPGGPGDLACGIPGARRGRERVGKGSAARYMLWLGGAAQAGRGANRNPVPQVPEGKLLLDPPLLRLESEAGHAYLSLLLHLHTAGSPPLRAAAAVEARLAALCEANLAAFEARPAPPQPLALAPGRLRPCSALDARPRHQASTGLHVLPGVAVCVGEVRRDAP